MKAKSFNKFIKLLESEQTDSNIILRKYLDRVLLGIENDLKVTNVELESPTDGFDGMGRRIEENGDYGSGSGSIDDEFFVTISVVIKPEDVEVGGEELVNLMDTLGVTKELEKRFSFSGIIYASGSYWSSPGSYEEPPDGGFELDDSSIDVEDVFDEEGDDIQLTEENKKDLDILIKILNKCAYDGADFKKILKEEANKYYKRYKEGKMSLE